MENNSLADIKEHVENFEKDDSSDLKYFLTDIFGNPNIDYASFSFITEAIDPLAYLEMCWNNDTAQYYWEKPSEDVAMAAGDELCNISAAGKERFKEISEQFEHLRNTTAEYSTVSHPQSGMIFLGGFSFFDQIDSECWADFEPASFSVPKWMIVRDGKLHLLNITVRLDQFDSEDDLHDYLQHQLHRIGKTFSLKSTPDNKSTRTNYDFPLSQNGSEYHNWTSSVNRAKELIQQQRFKKIVLARQLSISKNSDIAPTQVLNKLRQKYTSCYNFLIHKPAGKTFLGSTPERLGAFRNQLLLTEALAGSIKRGKTATEDTVLEKYLVGSRKNRIEHNYVIRDIEDRLQPLINSLDRNAQTEIKKLSNVQHLYTPIRAKLKQDVNMFDVISRLHPTPAVGGYPWEEAAKYINKLENFDRGWYAGPVGWVNTDGDGEFAVGIRSGLFTQSETHLFAGCGIVEDSDPSAEWEETNLKLKPLLSALQYD